MEITALYVKMLLSAVIIVAFVGFCYSAEKKASQKNISTFVIQGALSIAFGLCSFIIMYIGPEFQGTVDNIQDVVPLLCGLIFDAPAGILAGLIGGILGYCLHPGGVSQLTIGIALCASGVFAAVLRHVIFDNRTVSLFYGLAIGLVYAVVHVLIFLVANIGDLNIVYAVFSTMTLPLLGISALTVMVSLLIVARIGKEKTSLNKATQGITQTFQRWLLVCILSAFVVTCGYSWIMQSELSNNNVERLLKLNLIDLHAEILDISDRNLLRIARQIAQGITPSYYVNENGDGKFYNGQLMGLQKTYNVTEVDLIDSHGIIVASTNPSFIGFDMASGRQSAEFLPLLHGEKEIVQKYQAITYSRNISRKYAGVSLGDKGFLQVAYDASQFQSDLDDVVNGIVRNKHVGEHGGIIVSDADGRIISDNSGYEGKHLKDIGVDIQRDNPTNEIFLTSIHGVECICMYDLVEGYLVLTYIPYQEVALASDIAKYTTAFMEIVLFTIVFLLVYFLVKKIIVENIHKINESLAQITSGNLNVRVNVHTNDEFISLSDDINTTVDTLKRYIAEASARIDKELEFAKTIQMSSLPSVFPPYPDRTEFDLFACMDPAKEVGGDFYDFYLLDKNRLAFLIADVSGKGIPAAMFMMTSKTLIKSLAESGADLADVFGQANARLCENNEAGMFVTAWMGVLHIDTGLVEFVNAGHNPPLLQKDGTFSYLRSRPGFVLAGMEGIKYKKQQVQLAEGDMLLLYTDGLTEAMNVSEELFGEERVLNVLASQQQYTVQNLIDHVKQSVTEFAGEAEQSDDITMVALQFKRQGVLEEEQ